jgi:hypothetical protein
MNLYQDENRNITVSLDSKYFYNAVSNNNMWFHSISNILSMKVIIVLKELSLRYNE